MAYGVTAAGFVAKPLDVIKQELEDSFRATFGPGINLEPQSNFGQIVGIFSERLSSLWDLAEAVYASMTPDGAAGTQLDDLAAITGSVREPPSLTHVKVTLTGTPGTLIPSGSLVAVAGTGVQFKIVGDVTIPGGGTIANIECEATASGPKPAYLGTLTQIVTPVAGWATVTNPADHYLLGSDLETDALFRLRRLAELRFAGAASVDAIRARLLAITGVKQALVFEDTSAHLIECVVDGGASQDIVDTIYATKAAGIDTTGGTPGSVTPHTGGTVQVWFSRPTDVDVWLIVNIRTNASFPGDGIAQVKQALLDYVATLQIGDSLVASKLASEVFNVQGVTDVASLLQGTAPAPGTSTTITVTDHQIIRLTNANITVNVI